MSTTEEKLVFRSKDASNLFFDAVKTLPIDPETGMLNFFAYGIQDPRRHCVEDQDENYFRECASHGVIPTTTLTLYYAHDGFAQHQHGEPLFWTDNSTELTKRRSEAARRGVLNGGKINRITVDLRFGHGKAFPLLRDQLLSELKETGYELLNADLWITTRSVGSHYSKGDEPNLHALFETMPDGTRTLELLLGYRTDDNKKNKMRDWYHALDQKYGKR